MELGDDLVDDVRVAQQRDVAHLVVEEGLDVRALHFRPLLGRVHERLVRDGAVAVDRDGRLAVRPLGVSQTPSGSCGTMSFLNLNEMTVFLPWPTNARTGTGGGVA